MQRMNPPVAQPADPLTDYEREALAHFQTRRNLFTMQALNAELMEAQNREQERGLRVAIRARIDKEAAEAKAKAAEAKAKKRTRKAKDEPQGAPTGVGNAEVVELGRAAQRAAG